MKTFLSSGPVDPSKRVIRIVLVFGALNILSSSLIWGVNTLFLLDAGLAILGVFVANSVFTASMAVFEISTGVLADTRGRRISLLFGVIVMLVGTVAYVAVFWSGGGLFLFGLMSIVFGLGYTFYSGAGEAWADVIVGKAGKRGSRVAEGVPRISTVDSTS